MKYTSPLVEPAPKLSVTPEDKPLGHRGAGEKKLTRINDRKVSKRNVINTKSAPRNCDENNLWEHPRSVI